MEPEPVAEANRLLAEKGYRFAHLGVHVAPLPGKVLLKGSRIVSPFADSPDVVLAAVRDCVPPFAELEGGKLTPHRLRDCLGEPAT